jgi:hypothetical protein
MNEDVRSFEQCRACLVVARLFEVEDYAPLPAVEPGEVCGDPIQRTVVCACRVASVGTLDLDDIRAEVGELA